MIPAERNFRRRVDCITAQGVGLSVDAYSPDLLDLYARLLQTGLRPQYLEIFKAPGPELFRIRQAIPEMSFAYHGEGLWLTDPALGRQCHWRDQLAMLLNHARTIDAVWINLECASKQFGGYSFGTYLPPLFTRDAAHVTAENVELCQNQLDRHYQCNGRPLAPLLLLELPPLTYFAFGDMAVSEFFAHLAEIAACGFVLDIGHLWTIWRYHERRRFRDLERFLDDFLESFPIHRIVQIHLAGMSSVDFRETYGDVPWWVDAHYSPVPEVLWRMLEQILTHPGATALKGIALEVDTKEIELSVHEFEGLKRITAGWEMGSHYQADIPESGRVLCAEGCSEHGKDETGGNLELISIYEAYGRVVSGQEALEVSQLERFARYTDRDGLHRYTHVYLPAEILTWGGDLEALFEEIWHDLHERGIPSQEFVRFWFHQPELSPEPYDFFEIKLRRWAEFVRTVAPDLWQEVIQRVRQLLAWHAEFNQEPIVS
jgi:uncharacterized protein